MMKHATLKLGAPVVIAQADPSIRDWGPYQFPFVERLPDGRLHCFYHIEEDSARAYGKDNGHAVSEDGGQSWKPLEGGEWNGVLLPNGDHLRSISKKPEVLDPAKDLPREMQAEALLNAGRVQVYDPDLFPRRYGGYYFMRKKAGSSEWVEERHDIHIPFASRIFRHNLDNLLSYNSFSRLRIAPDETLWGIIYQFSYKDGRAAMAAMFVTSDDCGYHWEHRSSVFYPYKRVKEDFFWATRTGFTEPDLAFLPDGSMMCLCRTDDCFHPGPMYRFYSTDGGYTWSDPEPFERIGVWPCLMSLKNGVTVMGYGRPGLYLRATADPTGRDWSGDRITIVDPNGAGEEDCSYGIGEDTCSYCDILPMGDDKCYLVYSDFHVKNADGKPCKTILGRLITAEITE